MAAVTGARSRARRPEPAGAEEPAHGEATTLTITAADVLQRRADGPIWTEGCDEAQFLAYYQEPVTAFGLTVRRCDHPGIEEWDACGADLPAAEQVPVENIRYSTQAEGVLTSILADVIKNGTDHAPCDPEGWFNNPHPLLLRWPDGTYSIRDGNHRCIGAILRGDCHILAHVIPFHWPPAAAPAHTTPDAAAG